ncbi:DUF5060 domain-containing protein [Flavilitoribacter nigricans]|uniref:DUF5060 domain-containing protein n=1 Tax=Flavilitoribacter nigricans (strain ATCC 23147 / DSM 23189 / NBRC 102662 / NCIMB 1420 / SS-2) TaxID=1122177 RepID=A0A2D0N4P6_FLAN2|nr:DUF5060 domain-containing protein [Flavilitoribacter nigricans]PHN02763.1 DUF5060 domain-containing protein [Flavilitoribacter nigricans DSM 23189 = NBRC 102662]
MRFYLGWCLIYALNISLPAQSESSRSEVSISGELKKWHKVTLSFAGPETDEMHTYNPFLNYRLNVVFRYGPKTYIVPGYFAGDGRAGETSATGGDQWRVHFAPDETGTWEYEVFFRKGPNVAVSKEQLPGISGGFMDGLRGQFTVADTDKRGRDLRGKGRLQFVHQTYLQFAETGEYFLKAGVDAPENLLAYADFDGNFKTDGHRDDFIKKWEAHVADWREGDPSWQNGKGKGLIGGINYLAEKGLNAFSFLTLNIAGDDRNVFPYVHYDNYERMDISKLDQWEIIFEHADQLGHFLHFKTSEAENQGLLDNGDLGPQRKLYYRELIARFGHHLALNWNIGEENGRWMKEDVTPWQTTTQRLACARFFYDNDPYRHHVVIHNGQAFYDLLGPESKYTGLSIQTNREDFANVHGSVLRWRNLAKAAKKVWANAVDEPGDHRYSLVPDKINPQHDNARQNALWGALMAGAWGIEWYFGYEHEHSDLTCEDWRSRDKMWDQCVYALSFFGDNGIPYWKMEPNDLLTANDDFVLAAGTEELVVFQKMGTKQKTIIPELSGTYMIRWFNPRNGRFIGSPQQITAAGSLDPGWPPTERKQDWVLWIKRQP